MARYPAGTDVTRTRGMPLSQWFAHDPFPRASEKPRYVAPPNEVSRLLHIAKKELGITFWKEPLSWGARTVEGLLDKLKLASGGNRMHAAIDLGSCGAALIYERDERAADVGIALMAALNAETEAGIRWPMMRALDKIADVAIDSGAYLMPMGSSNLSWYAGAAVFIPPMYSCLRVG